MSTDEINSLKRKRQEDRFINKESRTSAKYLRRMEELGNMPESMDAFIDVLKTVYVDMKNPQAVQNKKFVGTYCVMAPQELIYAAGAVPVKLCSGNYTAFSIGDDIFPRDSCPLVKAVAGFQNMNLMPVYRDCDLMVVPVTCDCKKKIAQMLMKTHDVYTLHIPVNKDDDDIDTFVKELYGFAERLEEMKGNRITWGALAAGMNTVGRMKYELSEFLRLKKSTPYLIKGTHALAVMNAAAYMPADIWTEKLHELNEELSIKAGRNQKVTTKKLPRILITGSPIVYPNIKIPLLIEEMGGIVAADETCMGERGMSDPAVVTDQSFDGMIRALANQAVRPCSCPTFADNRQRIFRLKQMIKDYSIQGVIYHVLRGCLVYDFEYKIIEEELGRAGIPVIRLESDYNEEDVEQLRIRIEAFIELIRLNRKQEDTL